MSGFQSDLGVLQQEAGFGFDGNFFTLSSALGLTAKASGTQANATLLTCMINQVSTVASIADAVKLPASRPSLVGVEILVINDAANSLQVFGNSPDTINGVATATGVAQMGGSACYYVLKSFNATTSVGAWVANGIGSGYAGSFPTFSTQTGITAQHTSPSQATGIPITGAQVQISVCQTTNDAVTMPLAKPGMEITMINNGAATAGVYPAVGDAINAGGANALFGLVVSTPTIFYCFTAGLWLTK